MLKSSKQTTDPLRISQESLDLDDIISDLNSDIQSSVGVPIVMQGQPEKVEKQSIGLGVVKKQQNNPMEVVGTKKPENQRPISSTIKTSQQNIKNQMKASNKENHQIVINQNTQAKKESIVIKEELQNTIETKATTNEKQQYGSASANGGNQRYAESNISSKASVSGFETQNQEVEMPFYMKGQQFASNDEDVESFQRKLDTLIVNFRSETMSEFMKTKKQVLSDQAQTIDAERRRCNTLLGVKQNEIEQLKENLASKTKMCDELNTRCEGMAFWAGKAKMLLRIKLLQHRAFQSLKQYRDFQKHSMRVLEHRLKQYREDLKRKVFQGWGKQYKQWKIVKNREDFDKAVKLELQHICAQYNKEIETLREKLNEAQSVVDHEQRNKAMMQENLKKAFMRGVCALNFEAMNILNPNDSGYQQQIEREMERQVMNAMNSVAQSTPFMSSSEQRENNMRSAVNVAPFQSHQSMDLHTPTSNNHDLDQSQNLDAKNLPNPFASSLVEQPLYDFKKVESKDSLWKPAPIMGREINNSQVPAFTYAQPSITSQLKGNLTQNVVLSSHFNKFNNQQQNLNSDLTGVIQNQTQVVINRLEEDTQKRTTIPQNMTIVQPQVTSSLPDFVSQGASQNPQSEGKTIFANGTGHHAPAQTKNNGGKIINAVASKGAAPHHHGSLTKKK